LINYITAASADYAQCLAKFDNLAIIIVVVESSNKSDNAFINKSVCLVEHCESLHNPYRLIPATNTTAIMEQNNKNNHLTLTKHQYSFGTQLNIDQQE
jgi:hypothetical protein